MSLLQAHQVKTSYSLPHVRCYGLLATAQNRSSRVSSAHRNKIPMNLSGSTDSSLRSGQTHWDAWNKILENTVIGNAIRRL